jgi:hypothetical protein
MNYRAILCLVIIIAIIPLPVFSDTSLLHNVGKVQMLVSDWGAFTEVDRDQNVYPNFIYSGKAYLDPFSEIWVGDSSGHVASAYDGSNDGIAAGEWIATSSGVTSYITDSPNSNQTIYAQYAPDRYKDFPFKFSVDQYTYAWDSASSDDSCIIMKLVLTNNGASELKDFYIAVQTNWDVNYEDWEDDLMDWEPQRQAGIAYDSDGSDKTVVGLALISGKLASYNIVDAIKWLYTDSDRSTLMSNGEIDNLSTTPGNYFNVISAGPYNIPVGGSVAVVYSFVAGQGIDEFRANLDSAISRVITPEKLTTKPDAQAVNLNWSKCISPNVIAYKIYRSKTSGNGYLEIAKVSAETDSYKDSNADKESLSYYVVTAITSDGKESKYSNEVSSAPGTVPPPPSNLTIRSDSSEKPVLTWEAVKELGVNGYKIFRNSTGSASWTAIATIDKSNTSFIDVNTYSGNTYYYTITTINAFNWISEYSNVVSITLAPDSLKSAIDLREVKVVPQPCKASSKVRFINLTPMANINIYTLNGKLVKTIYHISGTGEEEWNLCNEAGISLASGVYVYQIEAYKPNETAKFVVTGKIAILK